MSAAERTGGARRRAVRGAPDPRDPSGRTRAGARALPVVPVRARGLVVEGADGRRYLDCSTAAGAPVLGHHHPVVLEAVRRALDTGAPSRTRGLAPPVEDAFAAELLATLPPGFARHARVRVLGPAGGDALAAARTLVREATGRFMVPRAEEYPEDGSGAAPAARPAGGESPAGLVLAPLRVRDGVLTVPDARIRRIRRITAGRAVPLVVDETETGLGRTGTLWAVEHSGVVPDVLVLPPAIGGGLPLTALVHHQDLDPGGPARDTRRGNRLALAAGTAILAHVRERGLAAHAAALGARMLDRLRSSAGEFPCVGEVRGRGLVIGVELVADPGGTGAAPGRRSAGPSVPGRPPVPGRPSPSGRSPLPLPGRAAATGRPGATVAPGARAAAAVRRECLRRGLIVDLVGPSGTVIALTPPLTLTEEQAAAVLDRLTEAIRTVAHAHPSAGPPAPE
ncbi:aminotransferase class III-fold pyridoxal phosphate-dependent enzyme [Streptomyces sp. SHP 1-2]|uniref:aminotransferase class III-fold pyridoxal phosphate-dependent enzyme n=1 Tax=Streptomyces sp. SHP 1-2 TaxID=2769489 RepID=UPI002238A5B5|nr:aminotransferase class III-fold pyridoxal phosphate-dependent enzyme [Streptomyces sp. SHP 1-2]MCW5253373.1 aminotransferase class III-fold pyridoxal phosphate-dependent enzyme [Streptomyces sp. SHP 1-2]